MDIIRLSPNHHATQPPVPSALAVGNFDGLHLGHQAVLRRAKALADAEGLAPALLSFSPHPKRVFAPDSPAFLLQRMRQKHAELQSLGMKYHYVLRFNADTIALSAEAFMADILAAKCGARHVITGEDFAFGHKRSGNVNRLQSEGSSHGFMAHTVSPQRHEGTRYASSAIRAALQLGDMALATTLLGRPHAVAGRIVHGDGRGASIGFATANIAHQPHMLLPAHGVYAVLLEVDGAVHKAVANCGLRPTFGGEGTRLEVHVLGGAPDLYGARAQVHMLARLRGEVRFDSVDALKAQIAKDCEAARAIHA